MPCPQFAPRTSAPAALNTSAACSGVLPIMVRSLSRPESNTMQATTGNPVSAAAATASRASSRSHMVSTTIASAPAWAKAWGPDGPLKAKGMVIAPDDVRAKSADIVAKMTPLDPAELK